MQVHIAFAKDVERVRKISWQSPFPKTTKCCHCKGKARLGFVAHEGSTSDEGKYICKVHNTTGKKGGLWLHDCCCVAVYFCVDCLETTALYNQA